MSPDVNRGRATGYWVAIAVLVLVAVGLYVWKVVAVNRVEERLASARESARQETRQAVDEATGRTLRVAAVPLGLAVRSDAMERDFGRLEETLARVVQEPGVDRALYAGAEDTVRASSDRGLDGRALADVAPDAVGATEVTVTGVGDGEFEAVVPITGLNERLGTVVLTYRSGAGGAPAPQPPSTAEAPAGSGSNP